jgi:hypothetical protein
MRIHSMRLADFIVAAHGCLADATGTAIFDAVGKVIATPAHGYNTTTSALHPNQMQHAEIIYSGGRDGAIFDAVQQRDETIRKARSAGRYLRHAREWRSAAVYSAHPETDGAIQNSTNWIAKARSLPVKEDIDTELGRGAKGKGACVHPPDGVKWPGSEKNGGTEK